MDKLFLLYRDLLKAYGPQGWWPISGRYHADDYSFPKDDKERFEIIAGCILTQNTSWKQVEKSLENLSKIGALDPDIILSMQIEKIRKAIKPAGYFNQKATYLKNISRWYLEQKDKGVPKREDILSIKGVGPETADSILLYAYGVPSFVIDAYTIRFLTREKIIEGDESYSKIKNLFEKSIPKDVKIYQEYHALIVENEKRYREAKKQQIL